MANADAPRGFEPVNADGQSYCGRVNKYYVPAGNGTAIFIGDLVKLTGTSDASGKNPAVEVAAAGEVSIGAVVGWQSREWTPDDDDTTYLAASTAGYIHVADDPDQLFKAQEDSDTSTLAATSVGLNFNFVVGAGDTVSGRSGMEIDSNTGATNGALPLQLLRLVPREDNELGSNAEWIVKINNHQRKHITTGV